jgi:hypothetical protein
MKNLILLVAIYLILFLTVFSVLFVVGCQENVITDPLYTESPGVQVVTNKTADRDIPQDFTDHPNIINFQEKLKPPFTTLERRTFEVSGAIGFEHNLEHLNPPGPLYRVTVNLSINAELMETWLGGSVCWAITGKTKDVIYLSGNHSVILVKYFKVERRSGELALACRFGIDKEGVVLIDLWLALPNGHSIKNVAQ